MTKGKIGAVNEGNLLINEEQHATECLHIFDLMFYRKAETVK